MDIFETTLTIMEVQLLMDGLDPSLVFVDEALPPSAEEAAAEGEDQ